QSFRYVAQRIRVPKLVVKSRRVSGRPKIWHLPIVPRSGGSTQPCREARGGQLHATSHPESWGRPSDWRRRTEGLPAPEMLGNACDHVRPTEGLLTPRRRKLTQAAFERPIFRDSAYLVANSTLPFRVSATRPIGFGVRHLR